MCVEEQFGMAGGTASAEGQVGMAVWSGSSRGRGKGGIGMQDKALELQGWFVLDIAGENLALWGSVIVLRASQVSRITW